MALVVAESTSTRDHEHIQVEDDLRRVLGGCRAANGERAQLRYVGAVVFRVFQAQFLDEGRAQSLRRRRDLSSGIELDPRQTPTYPTEDLELLRDLFALPPRIGDPGQVRIDAVPDQDYGTCALASE